MTLINSLKKVPTTTTANGAPAHSTTGEQLVDAQFQLSAARGMTEQEVIRYFEAAMCEDSTLTMRLLFYLRDVREGVGERRVFRVILQHLAVVRPSLVEKILVWIPEFGRWDDMLALLDTRVAPSVLKFISETLRSNSSAAHLCAKWMPREKTANADNKRWAHMLRTHMELTPRQYRKLLVNLTSVVETQMCAKEWGDIEYSHVPSVASSRYRKAFGRNDNTRYVEYLGAVTKGEKTMHAGVVTPYDILKPLFGSGSRYFQTVDPTQRASIIAQWNSQTNWLPENSKILTVSDMSGSMAKGTPRPIDICVALTQYVAERLPEPWRNHFITYSTSPRLVEMKGDDVVARIHSMDTNNWDMTTNLQAVFDLILNTALSNKLTQNDLPDTILILSDMQFNANVVGGMTNYDTARLKFKIAGYKLPNIVFWNLKSGGTFETKSDKSGVTLLGGFSATSMQYLGKLSATPYEVLMDILSAPRYAQIIL